MDRQIRALYRVWPSNRIARDMLDGNPGGSGYTREERERFAVRLDHALAAVEPELREGTRRKTLEAYARSCEETR